MNKKKKNDLPSLEELEKSIEKAKSEIEEKELPKQSKGSAADALRIGVELLAGVLVGAFSGYYLDKWFGTTPLFFLICFFLGVAGSGLNIYRSVMQQQDKEE